MVAGVAGTTAWEARSVLSDRSVAQEQLKTAKVQKTYDDFALSVRANAEKGDQRIIALQQAFIKDASDIQALYNAQALKANNDSNKLKDLLNHALAKDTCPVSPSIKSYLDGVRHQRSTSPAPANSPN